MKRPITEYLRALWRKPLIALSQLPISASMRAKLHRLRGVKIGKNSLVFYGVYIEERYPEKVIIGDNVLITAKSIVLAHKVDYTKYSTFFIGGDNREEAFIAKETRIDNEVYIGVGAIILPGVTIGKGAVVGAGSVVTKDVAPYTVVAGNPAKLLKVINKSDDRK